MAIKASLSCLSSFGLAATLSGCVGTPVVSDPCAPRQTITQSQNYSTVRPATQAIQDAVKSGSFNSGSGITSSMTASVGMTVTRREPRSALPVADCK